MDDAERNEGRNERRELVAAKAGRIDAVLAAACPDLSRARIQRLIESGLVWRNDEVVRKSGQVNPGDRLAIEVPHHEHVAPNVDFDLPILFEDAQLVVIDKPAGLMVHGAPGEQGPTVAAWFLKRYGLDAEAFDAEHPGLVHRLDKDTSGVMVLARTPEAQGMLSHAFEERAAKKTYLAVCEGQPSRERAMIEAPIGRDPADRTRMTILRGGRESRTEYEVVASDGERSLLVVRPETGRTHQIRVHLAGIGAPVAFDRVYGTAGAGRQQLHAWRLVVPHPRGGMLTTTAPLPADMATVVRAIAPESIASEYAVAVPARLEPDTDSENRSTEGA